ATQFPRRCLFIGTTNREEFLADETGNRRWAPIVVTGGDVNKIDADREQLWAEALVMWREGGIKWQELDRLAGGEHAQFM
ncbi:virulence-associated E family protein, partial [Loigolactobacillus coryniformis]|uniref:virulence-associated E family protein n=1 Tax=Loigolactobacillus coryniformis TaxID=1610 RepID=UPI00201B2683